MAIKDQAFFGIDSMERLYNQQIPEGEDELILRWNDSAKNLPIVRNVTMTHGVTKDPLFKSTFERIFKQVLVQSGYFAEITVHGIRRWLGKQIDSEPVRPMISKGFG